MSTPAKTVAEQKSQQKAKQEVSKMEEQLKTLSHQRGAVKGKLTRVKSAIEHSDGAPNPNIMNLHFLGLHQKTIEQSYREYNEFQNLIHALPLSEERRAEQEAKYIEFETMYTDLSIRLSMLMEAATKQKEEQEAATKKNVVAVSANKWSSTSSLRGWIRQQESHGRRGRSRARCPATRIRLRSCKNSVK